MMRRVTRIRETGMGREKGSKTAAIVAVSLLMMSNAVWGLSVTVNGEECVYEYVLYESDLISGNFVVTDHDIFWTSDHPAIDFTVTSPTGNVVHSLKQTSGDKFELKAPRSGMYKFCFHNTYSTLSVSFYIHIGHIPNEHNLAKDEHLDPVHIKIAELMEDIESISAELKYLKAREASHRHTNESTRKRVILYTLGEYIMLALASCLQGVFIKRLFSNSVGYNRV